MNEDMSQYAKYLQALLPLAGGALQWIRQYRQNPESVTVGLAVVFACAVYMLCLDWTALPKGVAEVQPAIIEFLIWFGTVGLVSVLGGTFVASKLANTGKLPIPETNSK